MNKPDQSKKPPNNMTDQSMGRYIRGSKGYSLEVALDVARCEDNYCC